MANKVIVNVDKLLELMESGSNQHEIANYFKCNVRTIQRKIAELRATDDDIVSQNIKLAKQKQKLQDLNRIERKSFLNQIRSENALIEYSKELANVFANHKLPKFVENKNTKTEQSNDKTGVVHISDVHFNELINLSVNKFDFNIASQRFKFLANQIKVYFKAKGITNIFIALTGDLMNSDRRLDELLAEATNRSKATFLSVSILEQFFLDLAQDFSITVASVIGNESRISKDVGWEEGVASDNYDYTIYHILKLIFRDTNIRFLAGNSIEQVVEVAGQNILLMHGNQIKASAVEKSIQNIKGKYTSRGINIQFVLFGHMHSARNGDTYARSSSVCGANAYSDGALQLESRASQNLHIFYKNGNRDSLKIDLQNIKDIKGYDINKELEAYNAKSLSKARKKVTINRVV